MPPIFYFTKRFPLFFQFFLLSFAALPALAQDEEPCDTTSAYLYWTGEENRDFFNERNWRIARERPTGPGQPTCFSGQAPLYQICTVAPDLTQDKYPKNNSLNPGQAIRLNLYIASASVVANGNVVFTCPQKGITMSDAKLELTGGTVTQGVISLMEESTVHLRQGAMSPSLTLNFMDAASWVYLHQDNPGNLQSRLANMLVNHTAGVIDNNFRINDYYNAGAVVRPLSSSLNAATIYNSEGAQGSSAGLQEEFIYSGASIPNGMDNAIRSFTLKRGFMASLAVNANGTSKSRVYIASEEDLTVEVLDVALQGNVSFIRVLPWNWVAKKGSGGRFPDLNMSWLYNWNNNSTSTPNYEYVPMAWGASGAFPSAIRNVIAKKKTTHLLGFNESDNCNDQSGQFNNLCEPAVAVAYYENLMGLGVRLGSPAPREEGPTGWLKEFNRIAKEKNVRFDFVAVHWYDWGSNPTSTPNATPQQIFSRFKAYLQNVFNLYKLPIWITEFNANPNRPNATHEGFLQLALPYLESLEYVERYAYFQPVSDVADYYDASGNLTNIGQLFKTHTSSPSMPKATYVCGNNLDGLDIPYTTPVVNSIVFEAECGKYIGNQWSVLNNDAASNGMFVRGDNSLPGATSLSKRVHYEFEVPASASYRVYIRTLSAGTGSLRIGMDGKTPELITPFSSSAFTWHQVPRFYDIGPGLHRLTIEFPNTNISLDQIVITNGSENLDALKKDAGYCQPSTTPTWGMEATNYVGFVEAENATHGTAWRVGTSVNAGGGAFLKSEAGVTSQDLPNDMDKVISFTVDIDKTDEYDIWAKIQAKNPGENSLWIAVDDQPFRKWERLSNPTFEWYWKKFHYSYGSEDRGFSYFLAAGPHVVKIAIAAGNLPVDRIAVVTKGSLPETTDPNVLIVVDQLEFEAEGATLRGTAAVVNCATSSNGKQVNMGNVTSNGVRFSQVVAETAGTYKLEVSYMSAVARSFRVTVNGVLLGRQLAPASGKWCFDGGSPGVYEVIVNLNRGLNVIDLSPFSGDAPFMDKIKLVRAPLTNVSLEAELAELVGGTTLVSCNTASNLGLVNPLLDGANGIRYKNLVSEENKTYDVDISYFAKVARNLRISVNAGPFITYSFAPTGNWCFEGGSPKVQTVELSLAQGSNTIELRATGTDAPFLDKILIKEQAVITPDPGAEAFARSKTVAVSEGFLPDGDAVSVYPNPLKAGTACTIALNKRSRIQGDVIVTLTDMSGRVILNQKLNQNNNIEVRVNSGLSKGLYLVTFLHGQKRTTRKLVVQ